MKSRASTNELMLDSVTYKVTTGDLVDTLYDHEMEAATNSHIRGQPAPSRIDAAAATTLTKEVQALRDSQDHMSAQMVKMAKFCVRLEEKLRGALPRLLRELEELNSPKEEGGD